MTQRGARWWQAPSSATKKSPAQQSEVFNINLTTPSIALLFYMYIPWLLITKGAHLDIYTYKKGAG